MARRRLTFAALAAAALLMSGCAGVPDGAIEASGERCPPESDCYDPVRPVGPGGELTIEGFEWGFDITMGVAREGPVTVTFENVGGTVHNFRIDEAVGDTKKVEAAAGEEDTGELQLFAGEYTYYCDIPGHRANGMEGTITVLGPDEEATDVAEDSGEASTAEPTPEPTDGGTTTESPTGGETSTEDSTTA